MFLGAIDCRVISCSSARGSTDRTGTCASRAASQKHAIRVQDSQACGAFDRKFEKQVAAAIGVAAATSIATEV